MICACNKKIKVRRNNTLGNPRKCKCGAVHWFCDQSLEFKSKKKRQPILVTFQLKECAFPVNLISYE